MLKFQAKSPIFSARLALEMWCCVVRTCIHCCLSVYYPSIDVWEWWEDPLIEYLFSSWSAQCCFYPIKTQIPSKITNFERQIILWSVMLCRKDMHLLQLEWLFSFLICIRMMGRASDRIFDALIDNTVSFLPNLCSNFEQNSHFWAPY